MQLWFEITMKHHHEVIKWNRKLNILVFSNNNITYRALTKILKLVYHDTQNCLLANNTGCQLKIPFKCCQCWSYTLSFLVCQTRTTYPSAVLINGYN